MKYIEIYKDCLIRVSFVNSNGYEKIATGYITAEDSNHILVITIKNEKAIIKKIQITNIFEVSKNE